MPYQSDENLLSTMRLVHSALESTKEKDDVHSYMDVVCVATSHQCASTTRTLKDPAFGCMRGLCPFTAGAASISAAERNRRFVLGSYAIVLAPNWVTISPADSYSSALFWRITETVPPPFEAKISLVAGS